MGRRAAVVLCVTAALMGPGNPAGASAGTTAPDLSPRPDALVYVANLHSDTVSVVDTGTGTVVMHPVRRQRRVRHRLSGPDRHRNGHRHHPCRQRTDRSGAHPRLIPGACYAVHGRSFSGLRTAQMCVIRPSARPNAATVTVTPPRWATRPGRPLTERSRSVMPGALLPISTM